MSNENTTLYEVFLRAKNGSAHRHVGSVHAIDDEMALQSARDVYTRLGGKNSIWVVQSANIAASDPANEDADFGPSEKDRKPYRHPTFYHVPKEAGAM